MPPALKGEEPAADPGIEDLLGRRGGRAPHGQLGHRDSLHETLLLPFRACRRDARAYMNVVMCRNIRVLYHFEPPATAEEVRAAALQFVRKVSGVRKPSNADAATFERAVEEVSSATERLLASLEARTAVRTRERERERARARGVRRAGRGAAGSPPPG